MRWISYIFITKESYIVQFFKNLFLDMNKFSGEALESQARFFVPLRYEHFY